jgi:hypothetical protein
MESGATSLLLHKKPHDVPKVVAAGQHLISHDRHDDETHGDEDHEAQLLLLRLRMRGTPAGTKNAAPAAIR